MTDGHVYVKRLPNNLSSSTTTKKPTTLNNISWRLSKIYSFFPLMILRSIIVNVLFIQGTKCLNISDFVHVIFCYHCMISDVENVEIKIKPNELIILTLQTLYNEREVTFKVELQRKLQLCTNYILCLC